MYKAKSQRHNRKRSQRRSRRLASRGGAWYNPLSWFQKEEPSYMSNLGMQTEEKEILEKFIFQFLRNCTENIQISFRKEMRFSIYKFQQEIFFLQKFVKKIQKH